LNPGIRGGTQMLNKVAFIVVLLGTSLMSEVSWASLLLEPYGGYSLSGTMNTTAGNVGKFQGIGFGARIGFTFLKSLFIAADGSYLPSMDITDSVSITSKPTIMRAGAVLGFSAPMFPIRFWGGFNFMDSLKWSDPTFGDTTLSGNSFKFGLGIKIVHFFSLNGEYIINSYSDLSISGFTGALTDKITGKSIFVSLSFPFNI
jgi:hypothetical protein